MRALLRLVLAAVLTLALSAIAAHAESADAAIVRLSGEYLDHWFPLHPARATTIGARRFDDELPIVTETSLADDVAWTRDLRARVDSVDTATVSVDRRVDRDLLLAACERDLVELDVLKPWPRDPAAVLPLVRDALEALADPARGPSCRRVQPMTRRLQQVPEVLRAARVGLTEPDSGAVAAAIPVLEQTIRLYRTTLGGSVADCNDASRQAGFAVADTAAVRALADYVRGLREEVLPRAGHTAALGSAAVARWLAAEGVADGTPEDLLARIEGEDVAAPAPGKPATTRLADSTAASDWVRASLDAAPSRFTARARPISLPLARAKTRVIVRRVHGRDVAPPRFAIGGPGAFEPAGHGWTLDATFGLPVNLASDDADRGLDRALVELARVVSQRDLPSLLRETLAWPATAEGVRADLTGITSTGAENAAAANALRTLLEGRGTTGAHDDPVIVLAVLGRRRMEALRDEARQAQGSGFDPHAFDDAVLAAGDMPWPMVRAQVIARHAAAH